MEKKELITKNDFLKKLGILGIGGVLALATIPKVFSTDILFRNIQNINSTGIGTFGSLVTTVGGLTLLAGQDIRPSANSTTAINIAQADGTDFVTFDTTNKRVGIGTTAPAGLIHVTTPDFVSTVLFERSGQTSDSAVATMRVLGTKTTDMGNGFGSLIGFNIQDNAAVVNPIGFIGAVRAGADNTGDIVFIPYAAGTGTEKMRLTSDGKVGIGTTSPSARLHVPDSLSTGIALFERSGQTNDAAFVGARTLATKTTNMGDGFGSSLGFNIQDDAGVINPIGYVGAVRAGADNTGDMVFRTVAAGSTYEKVRITSAGNVGIGTTAPTGKLNVLSTTEQLRLAYDVSNYMSTTIGSTGSVTFALTGTTPTFTFSQNVVVPDLKATTYHVGTDAGIDATVTYVDTLLGAKTLTFKKGILTAQT